VIIAKKSQQMLHNLVRNIPFSSVQQLLYDQVLMDGLLLR